LEGLKTQISVMTHYMQTPVLLYFKG